MAALTDKITYVGQPGTLTTLQAPGKAIGASTITVASTANYPTGSGFVLGIRKVDANGVLIPGTYTEFMGLVASGTGITLTPTPLYGTDQVYTAGTTTQVFIPTSASRENRVVDGLLAQHDTQGAHTNVTATSVSTGNFTATGTVILPSNSISATNINFGGAGIGVWWQEIGRATLTSSGDVLSVTGLPSRRYLKIIGVGIGSGATNPGLVFNNDTTSSYAKSYFYNNSGTATMDDGTSLVNLSIGSAATNDNYFWNFEVVNISGISKILQGQVINQNGNTSGARPLPVVQYGKWANTSVINRVDIINYGAGDFLTGSEIIVLGHN